MINRRTAERITPNQNILVKEDTGEIINYYHLKDISTGGMYLLKKISSKTEKNSTYTFLIQGIMENSITGEIYETRLDNNGNYGTAIRFGNPKEAEALVSAVKKL
ncbi:MAG: hypothetical protein NTY22_03260 [Proteobacteria bacterium]|nr:hypothetical protein [Pseudomonadota bacterium]